MIKLSKEKLSTMKKGGVWVPSPLALDKNMKFAEKWQRLLTLYYIKAGAKTVIPGTHTGEFAGEDLEIYDHWLALIKEMVKQYGNKDMFLMATVGGKKNMKQVEIAAKYEYDIVMLAPTAFTDKSDKDVIKIFRDVSSIIPTFGFELQKAIPKSREFSPYLWDRIFEVTYGAKGASFNTYRAQIMLESAARSGRREELIMATGNDDRIISDLGGIFPFKVGSKIIKMGYDAGLLGHFATDTHAAVEWAQAVLETKKGKKWNLPIPERELSHLVNMCNGALFDATGNFENSIWGVKYRLTTLGLLPGPYCFYDLSFCSYIFAVSWNSGRYLVRHTSFSASSHSLFIYRRHLFCKRSLVIILASGGVIDMVTLKSTPSSTNFSKMESRGRYVSTTPS